MGKLIQKHIFFIANMFCAIFWYLLEFLDSAIY